MAAIFATGQIGDGPISALPFLMYLSLLLCSNSNAGMFGRTGCGKTSLINSLKFAAHEKLVRSEEKAGGHTMFRKPVEITKNIYVIDIRGLDDTNTKDAIDELEAQLDGKRGYSEIIQWQGNDGDDDDNDDKGRDDVNLNVGDPIACAVFVFSAKHDIKTNISGLIGVVDFLHGHQGRYPTAIITNVDVADKTSVENLKAVLRVSGISDIFEVANVTNEKRRLEPAYQYSLLCLLYACMTAGDETLIFKHYQRKEQQRKMEKRQKQNAKRAGENRQMAERERVEQNQMKQELEAQRRDIERERPQLRREQDDRYDHMERNMRNELLRKVEETRRKVEETLRKMDQQRQRAEEIREMERREQERERPFEEALRNAEREKQAEIHRIMDANRRQGICLQK